MHAKEAHINLTTDAITPIMTIPSVSFSFVDTAAIACAPIIPFRIKKPIEDITLRVLGMAPPYNLHRDEH